MMAEFQKVMREWKRMCKSRGNIPDDFVGAESALLFAFDRPEEIERLVMEWSAEHPEPVYPTWGEWLLQQGVIRAGTETRNGFTYQTVADKLFDPIDAKTAEKLGIPPVEVTK